MKAKSPPPRLHYAYRGDTIKEIDELFEDVWLDLKPECDDSYQNDLPF